MYDIFEMQKQLNIFTLNKLDLDYNEIVSLDNTLLSATWLNNYKTAYLAEVGELITEAQNNHYETTHNLKIELVDLLHFIVAMSQIAQVSPELSIQLIPKSRISRDSHIITNSFNSSIIATYLAADDILNNTIKWKWWAKGKDNRFDLDVCRKAVLRLWFHFFNLCNVFDFTFEEMKSAYTAKNELNFKRQQNNYNIDTKTEEDNKNLRF